MHEVDIEDLALEVFVEALRLRHGYDFSGYTRASLKRRVTALAIELGEKRIGDLVARVLYEPGLIDDIIRHLSVPVSELFRDPQVFAALKADVLPMLASYPRINIWQAGCAHGEEVYSLAILLREAGLASRAQIYATDFSDHALEKAAEGVFPAQLIDEYSDNYRRAGGQRELADYYHKRYGLMRMRRELLDHIVFAHHNLVADGVFAESHLILCRNVLIYFSKSLKDRVLQLFADSLVRGGYLVLGTRETLQFSALAGRFECVSRRHRIYRLKSGRRA